MPKNMPHQGEDSAHSISPGFSGCEDNIPKMVEAAGGALWCPYIADISPKTTALAKELGLCVAAWTANEPTEIDQMIDLVSTRWSPIIRAGFNAGFQIEASTGEADAIEIHVSR